MIKLAGLLVAAAILLLQVGTTNAQDLAYCKKYKTDEVNFSEQVRVAPDGNLLLLTTIRRPNSLGQTIRDILLIKTKPDGDTLWTKHIGLDDRSELGRDFEILANGNILISGSSSYDMCEKVKGLLLCTDSAGNLLWDRYYGNETDVWAFTSMKVIDDGIIITGTVSHEGNSDALVLKTNLGGDSLWSSVTGGSEYDDAWDVEAADDGYLFTGGTYSFADGAFDDAWIVKLDAEGSFLWRKTFGTSGRVDWAWSFVPSRNTLGAIDGYVFTGIKNAGEDGTPGSLYGDVHFVKVGLDGTLIWDKSLTTPSGEMRREGTDIIATSDGGYAIGGYGIYRNGTTGQLTSGLYFIKTDAEGNTEYEILTDSITDSFIPRALIEGPDSSIYITGTKAAGIAGDLEVFLVRIRPGVSTAIEEASDNVPVIVYPNPANEVVVIHSAADKPVKRVDVLGIDGRLLNTIPVRNNDDIIIPVTGFSGTTILLRICNKEGYCYYKKVVVR